LQRTRPHGSLIANLLAQLSFGLLTMTICIPSMQQWSTTFGASQASVQLTFSSFVVAYACLQLAYGPLSDRLGRKTMLLVGTTLVALGSIVAALAHDLFTLTAARALQGAGSAAGMVVGRAMVQDLFEGPQRTRMMGFIGMALGLCPPLASLIGGQIHVHLGWQANFVLTAILAIALLLAAWRGLPDHHREPTAGQLNWLHAMVQSYLQLMRKRSFLLYVAILAMTTATFYALLAGAPIVLASYGVGPDGVGLYILCVSASFMLGNYLTTRWIQLKSERAMMVLGQICTIGGIVLVLTLALAGLNAPLALAVPLMILGVGHGFLLPPTLAGTVGQIPAAAGAAAAAAGMAQQLMGAAGGYAVGLLTHHGAANLGWLMLGLAGCGAVAQTVLHRSAGGPRH
jgi:DHA1 family bicyclomycin/chloramphenicol resistance-like MFS transporter